MLGVWSLVLATASLATMANLGITAGLVKFVADFNAKGMMEELHKLLFTAFITIVVFFGLLVIILYFFVSLILSKIVAHEYVAVAIKMLPFSLLSLFINEVGGVFTSVLDGLQKNYRRNLIYIFSSVLMLVAGYILVPKFGIIGMAYAQVGQSLLVAAAAFILSSKLINVKSFFTSKWSKPVFKQIFSYGVKFQFISVCQMLYEPTTKALISKFGGISGLSILGFYEMASRLVSQVKALIVNANQVMVPVVASAMHNNIKSLKNIYLNSVSIIMLVCVPIITSLVVFAPAISFLWIGHYEPAFVISVYLLCGGIFINILCGPAYFGFLGEGVLGSLLKIHFSMAVANAAFGLLAGKFLNVYSIIGTWSVILTGGSLFVMHYYQKSKGLNFNTLLSFRNFGLLLCAALTIIAAKFSFDHITSLGIFWQIFIDIVILSVAFIPFMITQKYFKFSTMFRFRKV